MTFPIGSELCRPMLVAALLSSALGCSGRTSDPAVGAAPPPANTPAAGAPADSGTAQAPTDMRSAPAPADTAAARPDSMMRESATADSTARASTTHDSSMQHSSMRDSTHAAPTTAAAPAPAPASAADTQYLKFDPATKTVTFQLVAGPFSFNGFTSGGGTLTVPPGSNNVWNFVQDDGTPHSAEVASGSGPVPNAGGDPAIPRAYTNKVIEGLVQGATDVIKFTAPDTGSYRIICGVPGHALSGMWIWLKIDPAAKTPSFGPTPK